MSKERLEDQPARAKKELETYWEQVGVSLLKASLVAVLGVLVRELVEMIDRRHRTYDHYDDY